MRAGALQAAVRLVARLPAAEMDVEREHAGVALHDRGVELERERVPRPVLRPDVGELRAGSGEKVVHAGGRSLRDPPRRLERFEEIFHAGGLGVVLQDDEGVGEDGGAVARADVVDHERRGHLDAARHVEKGAAGGQRGVERGEFLGAEADRLGHEMLPEKIGVLRDGLFERAENDPALAAARPAGRSGGGADCCQTSARAVAAGARRGGGRKLAGAGGASRSGSLSPVTVLKRQSSSVRCGRGRAREAVPRRALQFEPPRRQVAEAGEMGGEDLGAERAVGRGSGRRVAGRAGMPVIKGKKLRGKTLIIAPKESGIFCLPASFAVGV